jgi:hypothetical protein
MLKRPLNKKSPAKWTDFADKGSRQINTFEQILIAKVFNLADLL